MKYNHILLVEDNEIDAYITKLILKKADIVENITHKLNGFEAVTFLEQINTPFPEIIFLDIRMPEMDGFGFLEHFHRFSDSLKSNSRIYMLSSSNDGNDMEKAKCYTNVIDYLHKPFKPEYINLIS